MQKKIHSPFTGAGSQGRGCVFSSIGREPAARRRREAPESSWHGWKQRREEDRMKRILDYFTIDGAVGGNQEWFKNVVMYIGGCAAATACDCCIYLALRKGMKHLYPFDVEHLTREDYVAFSMKMKPCLRPRVNGVNKLYMFTEGFGKYLSEAGEKDLFMEELSGTRSCEAAEAFIRRQIDSGYPVPYLMLRHRKACYKDFVWHWFLCYGYEEREDGFYITVATYGESSTFLLKDLWDTGYEERGGLIGIRSRTDPADQSGTF